MEREHGRIVTVSTRTLGSVLDGDHAAGVTSLLVHDAGDFDESGGTLSINGATLAYSAVDDDASTITLTDPLGVSALDGDKVQCWSTLYATAVTEKTAMVQLDGDDDNPDPIEAWVPHFLADKLADGDRGGPGESVVLGYDEDDDEWQILDVRGLAAASGAGVKFCNTDTYTVQAAGDQTIELSHTPIAGSLHVEWHPDGKGGIRLLPTEWTLDASTLTVSVAGGPFAVGDIIDTQYAYHEGPITTQPGVPWEATGWKYLQVAQSDTTDRSAVGYDDSTWSVGPAPFGSLVNQEYVYAPLNIDWPPAQTYWPKDTYLWLRRLVKVMPGQPVTITGRIDNTLVMYWNGTQIDTTGYVNAGVVGPITVPGDQVLSQNTLALLAQDDIGTNPSDWTYVDVTVQV